MIAAVMQPYFFPYIGYFQLMHAVDTFVFFDDVQYINRGWVNRNRIRVRNAPAWLTMPVQRAPREHTIVARRYLLDAETVAAMKRSLQSNYAKAPFHAEVMPELSTIFNHTDASVAGFNANLLAQIARRLGINSRLIASSTIKQRLGLRGETKIIDICGQIGADVYVNAIGGIDLYDPAHFEQAGIDLRFIQSTVMTAAPLDAPEQPPLSIIDTLMHQGWDGTRAMLDRFELIPARAAAAGRFS
ncbi:WbqC family protein [Rhodanobacter umsongensis]